MKPSNPPPTLLYRVGPNTLTSVQPVDNKYTKNLWRSGRGLYLLRNTSEKACLYSRFSFHHRSVMLNFSKIQLFLVAKNPAMIYPWTELSLNNCLCLASYWSMELCICQSFCWHAFTLFVFYWRRPGFLPRGVVRVGVDGIELKSSVWCKGGIHAFCAACLPSHFMAPSVHKQTVKWWHLRPSFFLDSVNFLLIYMHICCWECV